MISVFTGLLDLEMKEKGWQLEVVGPILCTLLKVIRYDGRHPVGHVL
jgi:hypothetical protein